MNLVELVLNIQVGSVVVRNGKERRSSWWSSERALGFELDDFLTKESLMVIHSLILKNRTIITKISHNINLFVC